MKAWMEEADSRDRKKTQKEMLYAWKMEKEKDEPRTDFAVHKLYYIYL